MIIVPGISILAKIYESANSLVYRGIREEDGQPLILKVLRENYPTPQELARYRTEYQITQSLDVPGVVKVYDLQKYQNTLIMFVEEFGGESLKHWMQQCSFSIEEFLRIAIAITEAVGQIHTANIIHKDINPSNIVFNPTTGQVKIIDFGISTHLSGENSTLIHPNLLEGTLAYMSPEQTGRMNRTTDYRTDFYSLGVTFYELLAGHPPFTTTDAMELVHCHLAKQPEALPPEIPKAVANIVMKLLAKNPEDRYQGAWGLRADLETCLKSFTAESNIPIFVLGSQDISDKFKIPQKLYGREPEIETLLATFRRIIEPEVTGGDKNTPEKMAIELMLISGYSGIGKSALVAELYKPITEKRGYFISGKFDQFQRNVPYSAIVDAFAGLVRQLLSESEEQLKQWRDKLLAAFGSNGQAIVDVIPEVEAIVGKQPPLPELGSTESHNRFKLVFQNFIKVFCSPAHPLVIFLDDLQWADSATLKWIEWTMTEGQTEYLFLIGAYRDNEVKATHPLMSVLESLKKERTIVNQITLLPLVLQDICHLIADTLHENPDVVRPLAELVLRKTGGNPFFVTQFLKTLHAEKLLRFNPPKSYPNPAETTHKFWHWNIEQIKATNITDNIVDLMIAKLKNLPLPTQKILSLAACGGGNFDLTNLSIICEKTEASVVQDLLPAIELELIFVTINPSFGETIQHSIQDRDEIIPIACEYQFGHDRIQQAAYTLIDEPQKKAVHLQIGRLLLQNTPPEILPDRIFEIVDNLNRGIELIRDRSERNQIARLNQMAGHKAKAATAYEAAVKYFNVGLELLPEESWQTQYNLTLDLHVEAVETCYLSGDLERFSQLAHTVIQRARNVLDKIKIYEIQIQSYMAQNQPQLAIDAGLQVLEMLGFSLIQEPPENLIVEDLYHLQEMTAPDKLAALRILMTLIPPAYNTNPVLVTWIAFTTTHLCIQYGNSVQAAYAYAFYGVILCGSPDSISLGNQLGNLSLSLLNAASNNVLRPKVNFLLNIFIYPWKNSLKSTLKNLQDNIHLGLEVGDIEYAAYSIMVYVVHLYFCGIPLKSFIDKVRNYKKSILELKQEYCLYQIDICLQLAIEFTDSALTEEDCQKFDNAVITILKQNNLLTPLFFAYLKKVITAYSFKDYSQAFANAVEGQNYLQAVAGLVFSAQHNFYFSLTCLALYSMKEKPKQIEYMEIVESNQKKMGAWAAHAPINFKHKYDLVEAEKLRVLGQILEAEECYERAIQGAQDSGYIQEEALAYELAAEFYLGRGMNKIAQTYLKEALYCYNCWEATAKIEDLQARYPHLLSISTAANRNYNSNSVSITTSTTSESTEVLDLAAVMKASQAISSEIALNKLLGKLMTILMENAGAQLGYLTLEHEGQFQVKASGNAGLETINDLSSIPIDNLLPVSIINYVSHTQETVVLNNAAQEGDFTTDPYIQRHQTQSILCAPLINRNQIFGIVYLENNLLGGAFTSERLKVLQMLSGQAAIAIENARLYANLADYNHTLETKVEERTGELQSALANLQATQKELVQSEKMAALGQLVAGIAHEINTPLGAIRSSVDNLNDFSNQTLEQLWGFFQKLSPLQKQGFFALMQGASKTSKTYSFKEKRKFKRQLIQKLEAEDINSADTIADILVDLGIYDEVEPLFSLLKDPESQNILNMAYKLSSLRSSTQTIATATDRAAKIVFALKTYARYDSTGEKVEATLTEGIETILTLYQNQLKNNVELICNYEPDLPPIACYPDELNQVWTNLIHNAIQAMENKGTITIEVNREKDNQRVSITDTGKGIPPEILPKIFDPFFTTKPPGEGSGLGLDIVRKIVEKHHGKISVSSVPGQTTFTVLLPVNIDEK